MTTANLKTVGEIAQFFGVASHKIEYVLDARGIKPDHRASGKWRLYGEAKVSIIAAELKAIAANKNKVRL